MVTRLNIYITGQFCFKRQHSFFTYFSLPDFDECASSQNNDCHKDGICHNTRTHFYCGCKSGFLGDGTNCTGENLLFISVSFRKWTTINCRDKVPWGIAGFIFEVGFTRVVTLKPNLPGHLACYIVEKETKKKTQTLVICEIDGGVWCVFLSFFFASKTLAKTHRCDGLKIELHIGRKCIGVVLTKVIVWRVFFISFADIDECSTTDLKHRHNCHQNASCANTAGSFICTCVSVYTGDGVNCTGIVNLPMFS